jgi:hypothetical protein
LAVDLHAMRSRRCEAPETYGFSHLEPELTYMPTAMDAPCGLGRRDGTISQRLFLFWYFGSWPGDCSIEEGGWGTLGMGGDRARASRDRGSDDADADVGDPRGCRRVFWDAAIAGRPAPTPARPALPPGVLCVQSERASVCQSSGVASHYSPACPRRRSWRRC